MKLDRFGHIDVINLVIHVLNGNTTAIQPIELDRETTLALLGYLFESMDKEQAMTSILSLYEDSTLLEQYLADALVLFMSEGFGETMIGSNFNNNKYSQDIKNALLWIERVIAEKQRQKKQEF